MPVCALKFLIEVVPVAVAAEVPELLVAAVLVVEVVGVVEVVRTVVVPPAGRLASAG